MPIQIKKRKGGRKRRKERGEKRERRRGDLLRTTVHHDS